MPLAPSSEQRHKNHKCYAGQQMQLRVIVKSVNTVHMICMYTTGSGNCTYPLRCKTYLALTSLYTKVNITFIQILLADEHCIYKMYISNTNMS